MTEQYKVYSGVEKPTISRSQTRTSKYPFATMKEKDMFFVPKTEAPKTFSSQVTAAGRRLKRKFSVRAVSVEGVVGVGCWYEGPRDAATAEVPAEVPAEEALAEGEPPAPEEQAGVTQIAKARATGRK